MGSLLKKVRLLENGMELVAEVLGSVAAGKRTMASEGGEEKTGERPERKEESR